MSNTTENPAKKDPQLEADIDLLDRLLGVEARKPGNAAKLPAAIRILETLEPAGGKQVPVFPASYAGAKDGEPPVYDLAGVVYGEGEDLVRVKNSTAKAPRILSARLCAIDSPQSQANRMEPAFLESPDLASLVPNAKASIPRRSDTEGETSVLNLPHRVADFRVRLSDKQGEVAKAIAAFAKGDCLPLLRTFPTSLIFGFWNSRGEDDQGVKHARLLLARIDATDVVPCRRHSLYSGPYSKGEFAEVVLRREITDDEAKKLAKEGFSPAPSDGLGGVLVNGSIERLALLSLSDIARLHCKSEPASDPKGLPTDTSKISPSGDELTNAARRYLFALAALAESHVRSCGSHRLRSGCELVSAAELRFDFRGAQPEAPEREALRQLYFSRDRLIALAKDSMGPLGILTTEITYNVTGLKLASEIGALSPEAQALADTEKKAADAIKKAEDAEAKAAVPDATDRQKKAATKARETANKLSAELETLKQSQEAPSISTTSSTQPSTQGLRI
jgi:CRISPR-associated protein Csb1